MFDAKKLLDQFMGTSLGSNAGQGSNAGAAPAQGAGDLLSKGKEYLQGNAGGLAGGALAGGLAGILLGSKSGRKIGKKAVTYGGMALVAGLAYKAYRDYQSSKTGAPENARAEFAPPPAGSPFDPSQAARDENDAGLTLMMAMIAAAKADGHVDAEEQGRIFSKLDELALDTEAKAFVMDELRAPLDIDRVVARANTPEMALEIYAASRLTIEPDHPAEKAYLQMLAARLGLEDGLVAELERAVQSA